MVKISGAVFITGGGSGLGAAEALHFARAGWRVGIAGRSASRLEAVAASAAGSRAAVGVYPLDVRDATALDRAITEFSPSALVCCAAILGQGDACSSLTPPLFNEVQAVNVGGTFNACCAAMRLWKSKDMPGDAVTVSSLAGIRGLQRFVGFAAYAASKHAVIGLTEALALEGKSCGIRVNSIAPGAIRTDMSRALGFEPITAPVAIVPTIAFLLDRTSSRALNGVTIEIHCNDE
jgi:NAD(P)-dependent dehydrogenase (short-subunit alcohol dehydrogenase family)